MKLAWATISLLGAFCLVTRIEPWYQTWQGYSARQGNVFQGLLGESRRMLANQFYVEADAYFHSGFYPTMFDQTLAFRTAHMAEDSGASEGKNEGDESTFMGKPQDWIEALGRSFLPAHHTHLDEGGTETAHTGQEREILPWVRASAAMDPQRVESYIVASYWLRERMNKVDEAEQFLREGLMANPGNYALLYELGRSALYSRHDPARARDLWLTAINQWHKTQDGISNPDNFMLCSLYFHLGYLEELQGNFDRAHDYYAAGAVMDPKRFELALKGLADKMTGAARSIPGNE